MTETIHIYTVKDLAEVNGAYRMFLCEVKDRANDPWYAAVECLRQLRLFLENAESRNVFAHRKSVCGVLAETPVTGLVVAPINYYSRRGRGHNAVQLTFELLERFALEFGVDVRLSVWDAGASEIRSLQPAS